MGIISAAIFAAIINAGNPKYAPKPPALASYVIHAKSVDCLTKLMGATSGRSDLPSLEVGSYLKLKEIAQKCGGSVVLDDSGNVHTRSNLASNSNR